jgi:hypothetical protein
MKKILLFIYLLCIALSSYAYQLKEENTSLSKVIFRYHYIIVKNNEETNYKDIVISSRTVLISKNNNTFNYDEEFNYKDIDLSSEEEILYHLNKNKNTAYFDFYELKNKVYPSKISYLTHEQYIADVKNISQQKKESTFAGFLAIYPLPLDGKILTTISLRNKDEKNYQYNYLKTVSTSLSQEQTIDIVKGYILKIKFDVLKISL